METWAKVMGAKAVIGGGIEKMNKMLSGESKALKQQRKRQRAEEKEQSKILLAEEMATHRDWMRENGSYIQAIRDRVSGYNALTEEEKEIADARGVEEAKAKVQRDKVRKQSMASAMSGISAEQYAAQQVRNEAVQRKRQAERDLKKKSIANAKANELRISALAEELKNLGEFNELTKDQIIEKIEAKELETSNKELQEKINKAEEEYLGIKHEQIEDAESGGDAPSLKGIAGGPTKAPEKVSGDAPGTEGTPVSMATMLDGDPLGIESEQIDELLEIEREELAMDRRREAREIKAARMALEDRRDKKFAQGMKGLGGGPSLNKKDKEGGGLLSQLMKFGGRFLMPLMGLGGGWLGMKNILGLSTKADDLARAGELGSKIAGKSDEVVKAVSKVDDAIKPLSKVDDVAKVGTKVDEAAKMAAKVDDVAKLGTQVTEAGTKVGTKVDEASKVAAKGAKVTSDITEAGVKTATKIDEASKVAAKGAKVTSDIAEAGTKTATKIDEASKVAAKAEDVVKVADDLKKGVPSTNVGKLTTSIDGLTEATGKQTSWLSKVTSKMDETAKAVLNMGNKVDDVAKIATATSKAVAVSNVAGMTSAIPGGPKDPPGTMRNKSGQLIDAKTKRYVSDPNKPTLNKPTTPGAPDAPTKTQSAVQKGTKVASDLLAKGAKPISDTVKTTMTVVKTGGKLATRIGKVLAPLDIVNKMGQGQGFWESMGNMGMEIVNLVAGAGEGIVEGVQSLAGGYLGEGGFSEKSAAEIAFQDADLLGNKEKWQTSYLEMGINKGAELWTGQEIANKKTWTEDQEKMVEAAEDLGAVDVGFGQGDIESLEKLTLLDPDSLQALLDYEVWDDEDMGIIMELLAAKKAGKSVTYDDGGLFGAESIKYGGGVQSAKWKPVEGATMIHGTVGTSTNREFKGTGVDAVAQTDILRAAQAEGERVAGVTAHSEPLTAKTFDEMTPTATLQDATNAAMLKPGSIFVHDTHLEKLLGPALGASPEMPPAGMLENLLVTRGMENQANAEASQAGATQMINAPTTIDNTSTQVINQASSAHAPGVPAGSGQMGIGSRG